MLLKTTILLRNSPILGIQGTANDQETPVLTFTGKAALLTIWASQNSGHPLNYMIFPSFQITWRTPSEWPAITQTVITACSLFVEASMH